MLEYKITSTSKQTNLSEFLKVSPPQQGDYMDYDYNDYSYKDYNDDSYDCSNNPRCNCKPCKPCEPCKKCEPCKPCKTTLLNNFNDTNGKFLSFNNYNSPSSIFFGVLTILLMMTFIKHNFEIFRKNEAWKFVYTGVGCVVMLGGLYLILM